MLQDIGSHKNITQFFGAVMDEEFVAFNIRATEPQRVLKMLMELAISECVHCSVDKHSCVWWEGMLLLCHTHSI